MIWNSPDETYAMRFYANNVSNEAYIGRLSSSDNFGTRFATYGRPRQVGIELTRRF